MQERRAELWVRRDGDSPWFLDLLLTHGKKGRWLFKRDARISLPLDQLGQTIEGIPYLRPSVVLLHKAKAPRDKDQRDFDAMLPLLGKRDCVWLDDALAMAHPDHPWRPRLTTRDQERS